MWLITIRKLEIEIHRRLAIYTLTLPAAPLHYYLIVNTCSQKLSPSLNHWVGVGGQHEDWKGAGTDVQCWLAPYLTPLSRAKAFMLPEACPSYCVCESSTPKLGADYAFGFVGLKFEHCTAGTRLCLSWKTWGWSWVLWWLVHSLGWWFRLGGAKHLGAG